MSFRRWPTWMWANEEIIDLIEWLKEFNQEKPSERKLVFMELISIVYGNQWMKF